MRDVLPDRLIAAWTRVLGGRQGQFSLLLRDGAREIAELDADRPHYAASTIKLAVLAGLGAAGICLNEQVLVHDSFWGGALSFTLAQADDQDDVTWARLGATASVGELAERMISASGNLATALVLDRIGFAEVHEFLRRAGLQHALALQRHIGDAPGAAAGLTNTVTARGLARLLTGLLDGTWLDAEFTAFATRLLEGQEHRRMIPAGLPTGTRVASKGGWVPGVKHDVARIWPPAAPPYTLAICTTADLPDADGEALVAELSRVTWEAWTR